MQPNFLLSQGIKASSPAYLVTAVNCTGYILAVRPQADCLGMMNPSGCIMSCEQ